MDAFRLDREFRTIVSVFRWEEEAEVAQAYFRGDHRVHPLRFDVVTGRRCAMPAVSDLLDPRGSEWVRRRIQRGEVVLVADVPAAEAWTALKVLVEKAHSVHSSILARPRERRTGAGVPARRGEPVRGGWAAH
jgi:hypothetical protein